MGQLSININNKIERPVVQSNSAYLNTATYAFSVESFTKGFVDPQGGTFSLVSLESLPTAIELFYNSNPILVGSTFPANDAGNLQFVLNPKYAIHNGVLYEFDRDIDSIIADNKALGYELIFNTNGLLTFVKPANLTDIFYVQGEALPNTQLQFDFATSSSTSNIFSAPVKFSLIPWENVNIKDNFLDFGGDDGLSAYEIALANGFVGTETEWLQSLVGPQGPQGEIGPKGADGANGTSVTILGEKATVGDLPPTGNQIGDGYIVDLDLWAWTGTEWILAGEIKGPKGDPGLGLEFTWDGTRLGVRREGNTVYSFADLKGPKGDKGDTGATGPQGLKGNTGATGATGPIGPKGDKGDAGIDGEDGLSAYEVWLSQGNTGTVTQYLQSLKGAKGDKGADGEDASFTHNEHVFDWTTGQPQYFTVPDANAITDVYVDGKRAEKNNPNGTPDEWKVRSATEVEILVPLSNNDRVTLIESAKLTPVDLDYDWNGTELGIKRSDESTFNYTDLKGATGDQGIQGEQGIQGVEGLSAYEVWLANGNTGTEADYLLAIKGEKGDQGIQGIQGEQGIQGITGESAYEEWLSLGNTGTEADFIASLKGEKGDQGIQGIQGEQGIQGIQGPDGRSAYQVWLDEGNTGTVGDYLASLKGEKGDQGIQGIQGIQGEVGPIGPQGEQGIQGIQGIDGDSAYEVWLSQGNTGTEADYIASLKGAKGDTGDIGPIGPEGPQGIQGPEGPQGPAGSDAQVTQTNINAALGYTPANPANVLARQTNIQTLWRGTQAQYDAIGTKISTTLYFIEE